MLRFLSFLLPLALAALVAPAARALESAPVKTPHAEVTLVSESGAVEPGKTFRLGLRFRLTKGWHIYWVNPGDAGEPPHLDLTLPQGATASDIAWPTPLRIPEGPVMTYSYLGDVLLPLTVTAPGTLTAFPITAKASWLICEKICVPEEGSFRLDLPVGAASSSPEARLFAAADARIPRPSPYAGTLSPDAVLSLSGAGITPSSVREATFFPEKWGAIEDAAPQTLSVEDGKLTLALKPAQSFDPKAALSGVLSLTDAQGQESFLAVAATPDGTASAAPVQAGAMPVAAKTVGVTQAPVVTQAPPADIGVAAMLLFAFLGGLILNLMPCVFPILAIKAVAIAGLAGHQRGAVRAEAAAYTGGVLVAFAILAAVLIALRSAGSIAGWGFQFQSPAFVAALAFLFVAVGLNLSGVFEVGGGFVGAGSGLANRGGRLGSFFTGFLAVLVATPCTAPFMGAAIAAALSATPVVTLAVFLALGLGLAAPYALLALIPGLTRLLPKPGAWMVILRQALAFPMYAASAWLVWVISQQAGSDGVLATASGIVLVALAAWIIGVTQGREGRARPLGRSVASLAALGALAILYGVATAPVPSATALAATGSETPYSSARLASLRAEGRPVFVNMTAAWCVTCLVNERVALSSEAVKSAFAQRNVAYLKGDWTRADPAISDFLREHGRDGVPLYLLYPPRGQAPIVLPQLLTASSVLEELDRFGS
ncbi:thiol:disulfide interchange protein DsbD [Rhizobiales bacterium GAS191]|nr:thiol:disulfide interchange protein DsbD [Rhizobiales bacterium GAS191]